MTNTKSTKRALFSSVLALILCFAMLIGTTYAWFTDSVITGSNVIQTGNLDIEIDYTLDGTEWNTLDGANDLFQKGLWEPGHTEVVALRITNNGSLALKYTAKMNVIEEVVGKTKDGDDIVLSDILMVSTVVYETDETGDNAVSLVFQDENAESTWDNAITTEFKNLDVFGEASQELAPGGSKYVLVKVDMPTYVGNEANHDGVNVPSIEFGINVLATQTAYESDTYGNGYDGNNAIFVSTPEEAQDALDNAVAGTTIQLMSGVHYGVLELRPNIVLNGKAPVPGSENTEKVDYFTTKYTNEFVRTVENLTILGAPGATVDAIKFAGNTAKIDGASGGTMFRYLDVKNLVLDSIEFTDASTIVTEAGYVSPIFMDLMHTRVDGLTVQNCTLNGAVDNMNFVYAYGNQASGCDYNTYLKNINILHNTVSGIARLCELRECENVTVKGNVATNLTREVALFANNTDGAYSGNIVFDGNKANTFAGFFLRVGVGGESNIVLKNNVIANCGFSAEYPEYAQYAYAYVTEHTGTLTAVNNTLQ